mmetsp:Transcript_60146/g.169669  ORF Transcript_60146/g.169669 Transcript_60146/m.169669 type:complete len:719 (+) Transcript_60146:52-2208(+)
MTTVDLAVIGNGMFGALVDGRGRFVWCCMDTFDGDPVFNCLVNNNSDKTGFYDCVLENFEWAEQSYLGTSMVLVTKLHTGTGDSVEIRDFAPRFNHFDRTFRPYQLIRTVRRLQGDPRVCIRIRPTFQYNSTDGYQTRGSQHVRFCGPKNTWRVTTNMSVRYVLEEMPFLVPVEPVCIVFGTDESFTNSLQNVAVDFERQTVNYWEQWCNTLCLPVEFQEVLVRAAMTVAILQSADCGGLLSSLTTGMPLGPLGGATRETRVCRLLDECLGLPVMREVGLHDVHRKFLVFIKEVCFHQDKPQHTYNAWGNVQHQKHELAPYLAGYRGMGEVHSYGTLLESQAEPPGLGADGLIGSAHAGGLSNGREHLAWPDPDDKASSRWDSGEWNSRAVIYGLLVVSLAHAFFDIRLSQDLCTPKLFEMLERYAQIACDGLLRMSRMYGEAVAAAAATPAAVAAGAPPGSSPKPPMGAGFFDDDLQCLTWEDDDRRAEGATGSKSAGRGRARRPSVHTLASVLCWAAADRLQRIAAHFLSDEDHANRWRQRASELHEEICRHAWNKQRNTFTTYWGGGCAGPSLLRIAELGFISNRDARFAGTLRAFEADAMHHTVCFSSFDDGDAPGRDTARVHDLDEASIGASTSACFMTNTLLWYCEALRCTGAEAESRRLLEAVVRCSTHRGLLTEAMDLRTTELWGNSPGLAALLSLLRVASRLSRPWREV